VIIHGIGEQRPMATLRSFVGALLDRFDGHGRPRNRPGDRYYSKPDQISDSYELRRIKLRRAGAAPRRFDWPETDFYEYYWAHQMYGTTASHVLRWLLVTLWRSIPFIGHAGTDFPRLRRLALAAWLVTILTLIAVATFLRLMPDAFSFRSLAGAAGAVAVLLALWRSLLKYSVGAMLDVAGDAARYFDVNPKNVARRYDILRGGIALLRKLHEERDVEGDRVMYRYGRIVLVGHSLGSVIAYDILRQYWGQVNGRIPVDECAEELDVVERFVADRRDSPPPEAQASFGQAPWYWRAQGALWKAIRDRAPAGTPLSLRALWRARSGTTHDPSAAAIEPAADEPPRDWHPGRWLVSDLVTLGSPLAHAPVLLAAGIADLDVKRGLRELPTCPPDRSRRVRPGHYAVPLSGEAIVFHSYTILHHGACFAPTRWTNLWYSNDPVGGPLRAAFGRGIRDIRLPDAPFWLKAHTSYWRTPKRARLIEAILGQRRRPGFKPRPKGTPALRALLRYWRDVTRRPRPRGTLILEAILRNGRRR